MRTCPARLKWSFPKSTLNRYIIPMDFLKMSVAQDSESWLNEVKKNSALLVHTLADFGIESRVVNVNRGPVITLFELQIAPGIKVNRIVGLADDIAMALAAYRVRIVAPIPGKSAIGVEIPNRVREKVTLGDVIRSDHYQKKEGLLKVALGKDILGKPVMLDLKKLPHLLIAGATGSANPCASTRSLRASYMTMTRTTCDSFSLTRKWSSSSFTTGCRTCSLRSSLSRMSPPMC